MPTEEERKLYQTLKGSADELEERVKVLEEICQMASPDGGEKHDDVDDLPEDPAAGPEHGPSHD